MKPPCGAAFPLCPVLDEAYRQAQAGSAGEGATSVRQFQLGCVHLGSDIFSALRSTLRSPQWSTTPPVAATTSRSIHSADDARDGEPKLIVDFSDFLSGRRPKVLVDAQTGQIDSGIRISALQQS
jgi:hypothetical protein